MNQLRKRPFMLISFSRVPSKTNPGEFDAIENMQIVDSVSTKHLQYSDFVIDLLNQTVVKNRHGGDPKTIYDGYMERYYEDVKGALSGWIAKSPENLEILQRFLTNVKALEETNAGEANESEQGDSN